MPKQYKFFYRDGKYWYTRYYKVGYNRIAQTIEITYDEYTRHLANKADSLA